MINNININAQKGTHINHQLAHYRRKNNLTVNKLAAETGLKKHTLHRLESCSRFDIYLNTLFHYFNLELIEIKELEELKRLAALAPAAPAPASIDNKELNNLINGLLAGTVAVPTEYQQEHKDITGKLLINMYIRQLLIDYNTDNIINKLT